MGEGERCENKKSDMASLGRKLKLHLLVYIIDSHYPKRIISIVVGSIRNQDF